MTSDFWWGIGGSALVTAALLPVAHKYNQGADKRSDKRTQKRKTEDAAFKEFASAATEDEGFFIAHLEQEKSRVRTALMFSALIAVLFASSLFLLAASLAAQMSVYTDIAIYMFGATGVLLMFTIGYAILQDTRASDFARLVAKNRLENLSKTTPKSGSNPRPEKLVNKTDKSQ